MPGALLSPPFLLLPPLPSSSAYPPLPDLCPKAYEEMKSSLLRSKSKSRGDVVRARRTPPPPFLLLAPFLPTFGLLRSKSKRRGDVVRARRTLLPSFLLLVLLPSSYAYPHLSQLYKTVRTTPPLDSKRYGQLQSGISTREFFSVFKILFSKIINP